MANETTTTTTTTITQTQAQTQADTQAAKAVNNLTTAHTRQNQKTAVSTNMLNKYGNSIRNVVRSLTSMTKAEEKTTDSLVQMDKNLSSTTERILEFSGKGRKALLGVQVEMQRVTENMIALAIKTEATSRTLDNHLDRYDKLAEQYKKNAKELNNLKNRQKESNDLTEEETKRVATLTQEQKHLHTAIQKTTEDVKKYASELHRQNAELVETHKRNVNNLRDAKLMDIEARKLKGGFQGIVAGLEGIAHNKVFQWIDGKIWMAMLAKAGQLASEAFKKTASMYQQQTLLARQYGYQATTGMDGFVQAAKLSEKHMFSLAKTAARLHMELEGVEDIANQIQAQNLGVFGAKGAADAEANILKLTDAAAQFSKMTGVTGADAVEMLRRRTEDMGQSSKQAAAELSQMTMVLGQMQGAVDGDVVGMHDMVKLIEAASAASGGYIVDTRLMTQSMRAAANEAERLGASKKLAMKTAAGAGTLAGGGGGRENSITSLLAGLDLAKQLRIDPTPLLKGLDKAQRTALLDLRKEALAMGKSGDYQIGHILEVMMSGSEAMEKANWEMTKQIYGKKGNNVRYEMLAELWKTDVVSARMIWKNRLAADEAEKKVNANLIKITKGKEQLPMGLFIQNHLESVMEEVKQVNGAEAKIKALQKRLHISPTKAKELLDLENDQKKSGIDKLTEQYQALQKANDPTMKAREVSQHLKEMKDQKKSTAQMLSYLKDEYGFTKKNKEAMEEANKIAEKASNGDKIGVKSLTHLGETTTKELAGIDLSNSILQHILDEIKTGNTFLGKRVGDLVTHLTARGATSLAVGGGALGIGGIGAFLMRKRITSFATSKFPGIADLLRKVKGGSGSAGGGGGKELAFEKETEKLTEGLKAIPKSGGIIHPVTGDVVKSIGEGVEKVAKSGRGEASVAKTVEKIVENRSIMGRLVETVTKIKGGGKGKLIVGGLLAAGVTYSALSSGEAKAETNQKAPPPPPPTPPQSELRKNLGTAETVGGATHLGAIGARVGLAGAGRLGVVGAELAGKSLGRIIPGIGSIVGAVSTINIAMDIWQKHKSGKKLTNKDWIKLGMNAASIIPIVGEPFAVGAAAIDAKDIYDSFKTSDKMAADLNKIAEHSEQRRDDEIKGGKPLPTGGDFNQIQNAKAAAQYNADAIAAAIADENKKVPSRPSLDTTKDTGEKSMVVDANTYNAAEDSFMVKMYGLAGINGLFKKIEATHQTGKA